MGYEAIVAVIGDLALRGAGSDSEIEGVFAARGWSASFEYPQTQLWVHDKVEARLRRGGEAEYVEFTLSELDTDWGPSEGELADAERDLTSQIGDIVGSIARESEIVEVDPVDATGDLASTRAFTVGSCRLLFGVLPGDGVIPMMNIARLAW